MRWCRTLAGVAGAFATASCGLIVDLSSLGSDAGASDTGTDGITNDGSPTDADAGQPSCDGAGYCACVGALHAVCTDFDPPDASLQGPLDGIVNVGGATGALDTSKFASSPRSAKFDFVAFPPDAGSSASAGYALYWDSKTSGTDLIAEAKVFLPARPSAGYYELIDIGFPNGSELDWELTPTNEQFLMLCHAPCTPVGDAGTSKGEPLGFALPTNKWVDVVIHATIGGSTLSYSITYDGIVAGSGTNRPYAYPVAFGAFYIGATFETPGAVPFSIFYDDVTFDQK